jgi:transglutaminase-like putative cysteine protease
VQAVCDWIHGNVEYGSGSTSATDSLEVYEARRGVCRDFAHLGVTFCRALNIPARYVCGYLPDIGVEPPPTPMDFHAWFEAYLDGAWRTFDARHNMPRIGRILIARGRDAADGAWATAFGSARLARLDVWADEATIPTPGDAVAHSSQEV